MIARQRAGAEIEQPGRDHAATPPDLGDVWQVDVEAFVFGQARRGLIAEDVKAFGIGLHQAVLDAVVNHLHEVACACRAGMDIAACGTLIEAVTSRGQCNAAGAGRERCEDRVEVVDSRLVATDHHAVATLQPPYTAGRADIDIAPSLGCDCRGATDVVLVEGVAAIDDDIAWLCDLAEFVDGALSHITRRQHHPEDPRRRHLRGHVLQRRRRYRSLAG